MPHLQPVISVALDAQRLRHEAGQVAAMALWDESAAAGLLLFCLPEAGMTLERRQSEPQPCPVACCKFACKDRAGMSCYLLAQRHDQSLDPAAETCVPAVMPTLPAFQAHCAMTSMIS